MRFLEPLEGVNDLSETRYAASSLRVEALITCSHDVAAEA